MPEGQPPAWQLAQPRISAAEAATLVPDLWRRFALVRAVPANVVVARRIRGEGNEVFGANLAVNYQGLLVATKTGALVVDHLARIALMDVHRFPALDDRPKTVVLNGSAVIDGPVGPGWTVRATGDVEVRGFVNEATIVAGGSILVRGDVAGTGASSVLVAGWDVIVKQAADAELLAGHDVAVGEQLLNCNVTADGRILVGMPPMKSGIVSGGLVHAGREIALYRAGSSGGFPPELMIGPIPGVADAETELSDLRQGIAENLRRYETATLSPRLRELRQTYRSQWSLCLKERAFLNLSDGQPYLERVAVFGTIARGAQITIGTTRYPVGQEIGEPRQFVLRGEAIAAEPAIPLERPTAAAPSQPAQKAVDASAAPGRVAVRLPHTLINELDLVDMFTSRPGGNRGEDIWNQVRRLEGELMAATARGSVRRLRIKDPQTGMPLGYAYRRDDVVNVARELGLTL